VEREGEGAERWMKGGGRVKGDESNERAIVAAQSGDIACFKGRFDF